MPVQLDEASPVAHQFPMRMLDLQSFCDGPNQRIGSHKMTLGMPGLRHEYHAADIYAFLSFS